MAIAEMVAAHRHEASPVTFNNFELHTRRARRGRRAAPARRHRRQAQVVPRPRPSTGRHHPRWRDHPRAGHARVRRRAARRLGERAARRRAARHGAAFARRHVAPSPRPLTRKASCTSWSSATSVPITRVRSLASPSRCSTRPRSVHGLDEAAREYLEAAALLANVGLFISHTKHHLHTYYVIRNSEHLTGFTDREIEIIAQVARYHRKSPPKPEHEAFSRLWPDDQRLVRALAALLRVAIGLDRSYERRVATVRCQDDGERLTDRARARRRRRHHARALRRRRSEGAPRRGARPADHDRLKIPLDEGYLSLIDNLSVIDQADPRARRKEAKREEILAAAWTLAHRDGLGAISLRDLAAMVGLRQPSLYAYFDSKHALYDAMFEQGNRALLAATADLAVARRPSRSSPGLRPSAVGVLERRPRPVPPLVPTPDPRVRAVRSVVQGGHRVLRAAGAPDSLRPASPTRATSISSRPSSLGSLTSKSPMTRAATGGSASPTASSRCSSPYLDSTRKAAR